MPFSTTSPLSTSQTFNDWFDATNNVISYVANSSNFVATTSVTTGNVTLNGSATIYGGLTSNANTYLHGSSASDAVLYVTKATGSSNVVTIKSSALDITSGTTTFYGPGTLSIQAPTTISALVNATSNIAVSNATSNTIVAPGRIVFDNGTAINATSYAGAANNTTYLNGQLASYYTNADNLSSGTVPLGRLHANVILTTSTTGMNASALSTGTVPAARLTSANTTSNGVVDTSAQTFAGIKTFTANVLSMNANMRITRSDTTSSGLVFEQNNSTTFVGANAFNGTYTIASRNVSTGQFVIYSHASATDVLTINSSGYTTFSNAIYERARTVAMGEWATYSPVWTSTGTAPSIGNGTIEGEYTLIGKTVHYRIRVAAGSSTSFGTGSFAFGLPVAAQSSTSRIMGMASIHITDARTPVFTVASYANTTHIFIGETDSQGGAVGYTGGTTDSWEQSNTVFQISGTYPIA